VFGWGFGRFRVATQSRFSADFVRTSARDEVRQAWFDAHNVVLNVAVGVGVVGLVLILVWLWQTRNVSSPAMSFSIAVALTWLAQPAGLATLPMVAIVWGAGYREPQPDVGHTTATARRPAVSAVLVGLGLVAAFSLFIADSRLKHAVDSGDPERVESAAALYVGDAVVADIVAQTWFNSDVADDLAGPRVIEWSQRATDREPDRPYFWNQLGYRQAVFGDLVAARDSFERALQLQPWNLQSWRYLDQLAVQIGDDDLEQHAQQALCELGEPNTCT
jgi:hypothetical protein